MKLKDLKKLLESASDNVEMKVDNGEIIIINEYKFNIGDKVRIINGIDFTYTIIKRYVENGVPQYVLSDGLGKTTRSEICLELIPQDITERIKTFQDACEWCRENGKNEMLRTYAFITNCIESPIIAITEEANDIIAYLKLRIITTALNEGWEPTFDKNEKRWKSWIEIPDRYIHAFVEDSDYTCQCSHMLCFKSKELAEYATNQFTSLYEDFCSHKKGGKQ